MPFFPIIVYFVISTSLNTNTAPPCFWNSHSWNVLYALNGFNCFSSLFSHLLFYDSNKRLASCCHLPLLSSSAIRPNMFSTNLSVLSPSFLGAACPNPQNAIRILILSLLLSWCFSIKLLPSSTYIEYATVLSTDLMLIKFQRFLSIFEQSSENLPKVYVSVSLRANMQFFLFSASLPHFKLYYFTSNFLFISHSTPNMAVLVQLTSIFQWIRILFIDQFFI